MLDTVVTSASLLGLLGTILAMMHSFKLIGSAGLVGPGGITAVGLLIALVGFNYLSRLQAKRLDEMERLGSDWSTTLAWMFRKQWPDMKLGRSRQPKRCRIGITP